MFNHDNSEPEDESCVLNANVLFDGLIDAGVHMRDHHLDGVERSERRVLMLAIAIASSFTEEVMPGMPSPVAILGWGKLAIRMAERGMEQELRETHALLSGPDYNRNMRSAALRMAIEVALEGLDTGELTVKGEPQQPKAQEGNVEGTVSLDEMPSWIRSVFEQPHED